MFSVAVCSSLVRILSQVQWWSVSMVTRYDVISRRWSSHFFGKSTCFFRLFSTIKVNHVAKIMQSAYSCVIFHLHHKKSPSLVVLPWFLILGKIQDSGQDGDHCWSQVPAAPPPIKYTSFCRKDQRLSTEGKIVWKYCQISKTVRGISSTPPPPPTPPCTTVGVWICMYVRGLM